MVKKKKYSSVTDLVRGISENKEFARDIESRIGRREIIKQLMALRAAKKLSQSDIAASMKCTQSRVSKLENSTDAELTLEDLVDYADALDFILQIGFIKKNRTIVEEVKHHAFSIKRSMNQLAKLAHGSDPSIIKAVADFHGEAFFNLLHMIQESAANLPVHPDTGAPYIQIEMLEYPGLDEPLDSSLDSVSISADESSTKPNELVL